MNRLLLACAAVVFSTSASAAVLEVPANGGDASGIGYFSGWKCPPNDSISLVIDGGAPIPVATGIRRGDTASACGNTGFNGFISQFNFNLLGDGPHAVSVRQNGQQFAAAAFHVTTLGSTFLSGASGDYTLQNFPSAGRTVTIEWSQGAQNFVIAETGGAAVTPTPKPGPTPKPTPKPTAAPTAAPTPGKLSGLLGTWLFTYSIGASPFADTIRLQQIITSQGVDFVQGVNQFGDPVLGGRSEDVFVNPQLFDWSLVAVGSIICDAYVFDRTGDAAVGQYYLGFATTDGSCTGFHGNYPLLGARTSHSATATIGNAASVKRASRRSQRAKLVEAREDRKTTSNSDDPAVAAGLEEFSRRARSILEGIAP